MIKKRISYPHFIFSTQEFQLLEEEVFNALQKNLPAELTYHSVQHTKNVLAAAITIASEEFVQESDLLKIKIAALLHDTGFMFTYEHHEEASCEYAKKLLPLYHISNSDIDHICEMIMATKIPQTPKDLCSEILADADLEYFGTEHFKSVSDKLFEELKYRNPILSLKDWNQIQINFLSKHQFFTNYCKINKAPIKDVHLKALVLSAE